MITLQDLIDEAEAQGLTPDETVIYIADGNGGFCDALTYSGYGGAIIADPVTDEPKTVDILYLE